MAQYEERKQAVERQGWNHAEIDRRDGGCMVAQECPPSLRRRPSAPDHVFGDRRLGDFEPELEQFTMDARGAPQILEAERKQLPFFEPYETGKLLADAARANNGPASDAAIADVYNEHWRAQIIQLLRALGCDPNDKQVWPKAFMKLARLHHNVGRLVHRLRSRPNAKVWTPKDESNFLLGVYALVQRGLGEREAVRRIADAKVFPHYERQSSQRPSGHATRIARQRALWRKYQRLRAQSRGPDPIGRQLAIGVTDFEMFLTGLGLPAPSAAPSGDKPRARK